MINDKCRATFSDKTCSNVCYFLDLSKKERNYKFNGKTADRKTNETDAQGKI